MPVVRTDGCEIRYEVQGTGAPVTLLHGFTSFYEQNWVERGWVDLLTARGHQVIGVDLRGHGRSSKLYRPEQYETADMARDVVTVLDEVGVVRSDIVGFSMGAGVGLQLAMDFPARVRRLVVAGAGDAAIRGLHDPHELEEIAAALESGNPETIDSALGKRVRAAAERGGNDLKALGAMMRRGGWPGDVQTLRPLAIPVLVGIAGRDDYMAGADRLLAGLPEAKRIALADAAHTEILEDDEFRNAVVDFLCNGR
jgi:pimeloyl-ACP methyl ester carboxylesterase